jgi:hypothetical protein
MSCYGSLSAIYLDGLAYMESTLQWHVLQSSTEFKQVSISFYGKLPAFTKQGLVSQATQLSKSMYTT